MGVRGYNNTREPKCEILYLLHIVAIIVKASIIKDC